MYLEKHAASNDQLAELMALSSAATVMTQRSPESLRAASAVVDNEQHGLDFFVDRSRRFNRLLCSLGTIGVGNLHPSGSLPQYTWLTEQEWFGVSYGTLERRLYQDVRQFGRYMLPQPIDSCFDPQVDIMIGTMCKDIVQGHPVIRTFSWGLVVREGALATKAAVCYGPADQPDVQRMQAAVASGLHMGAHQAEDWAERITDYMARDIPVT